eukprot:1981087-Pyramimonas_sp.AAC.1
MRRERRRRKRRRKREEGGRRGRRRRKKGRGPGREWTRKSRRRRSEEEGETESFCYSIETTKRNRNRLGPSRRALAAQNQILLRRYTTDPHILE